MRPSNNLKKKVPSDTYLSVQIVCIKFQDYHSLEPSLGHSQDQVALTGQFGNDLFKELRSYRSIM